MKYRPTLERGFAWALTLGLFVTLLGVGKGAASLFGPNGADSAAEHAGDPLVWKLPADGTSIDLVPVEHTTTLSLPDSFTLRVQGHVLSNLALMFSQFTTEYIVCLTGVHTPDSINITGWSMPFMTVSEPETASAAYLSYLCEEYFGTVAVLHNHLAGGDEAYCWFSAADVTTFLETPFPIEIVQCGPMLWSVLTRLDAMEGPDWDDSFYEPTAIARFGG